ncbi:MAG: glycosyltransferase family 4 protein [Vicinamibacteria bacterium]|nr:glycosyltransferase family 4 protein [Vicinamibacteria bacterium]
MSGSLATPSAQRRDEHSRFEADPFPGQARVLFVGPPDSSHTHSWIDLLAGSRLNVRLFGVPNAGPPPDDWPIRTYLVNPLMPPARPGPDRLALTVEAASPESFALRARSLLGLALPKAPPRPVPARARAWLARVIREWRPHVIHTLGLFDGHGGAFYQDARREHGLEGLGQWVLQLRGGSDLFLRRHDPAEVARVRDALAECDTILTDNRANVAYVGEWGIPASRFSELVPVPGTGGVDVDALASRSPRPPSQRARVVVWPKAYECAWSKSLPVLEALRLAWERIRPCRVVLLAADDETRQWFRTLPDEIRSSCELRARVPRSEFLELLASARVLLAPSLVDGVPNSLYEAMACGAIPIVSPLPTIRSGIPEDGHVLWARNLHPAEIADALATAMHDDAGADAMRTRNLEFVARVADRAWLRERAVDFYARLVAIEQDRTPGRP